MRVFITGAGMVGCHTARELVARGDEVTLLDLAPTEAYVRRVAGEGVEVRRGDVRELPGLVEALQAARPEVVLHTAALIGSAAQLVPYRGFSVNLIGTLNVAEAARLTGVRRLVHASTLGVHDLSRPQAAPLGEDFPTGTRGSTYGASKVAAEQVLRVYAATYGLELAMLRFASAFGHGPYAGGSDIGIALHRMARAALDGRPVPVPVRLAHPDELVYIRDLARGVAAAVAAERVRPVYNLGAGRLATADDVLAALGRVVPGVTVGEREPAPPNPNPRRQPMDLAAARSDLGYEVRYDLEAGLADFVAELRAAEG